MRGTVGFTTVVMVASVSALILAFSAGAAIAAATLPMNTMRAIAKDLAIKGIVRGNVDADSYSSKCYRQTSAKGSCRITYRGGSDNGCHDRADIVLNTRTGVARGRVVFTNCHGA